MKNIQNNFWRMDSMPSTSKARKSSKSRFKFPLPLKKTISLGNRHQVSIEPEKLTQSLIVKKKSLKIVDE